MFLVLQGLSPLLKVQLAAQRRATLLRKLPALAATWFGTVSRITRGDVRLAFDVEAVRRTLRDAADPMQDPDARAVVLANARWNLVWGRYYVDLLASLGRHPGMRHGFENVVRYNEQFLASHGEPAPVPTPFDPTPLTGTDGFDLIAADFVANSYTDRDWGELASTSPLRHFRERFVAGQTDELTGRVAAAIALAEIEWSNGFFPLRDVSDMAFFEGLWRAKFRTSMLGSFLEVANRAGAGLPDLSPRDVILRVARAPDVPIETALGVVL